MHDVQCGKRAPTELSTIELNVSSCVPTWKAPLRGIKCGMTQDRKRGILATIL